MPKKDWRRTTPDPFDFRPPEPERTPWWMGGPRPWWLPYWKVPKGKSRQ